MTTITSLLNYLDAVERLALAGFTSECAAVAGPMKLHICKLRERYVLFAGTEVVAMVTERDFAQAIGFLRMQVILLAIDRIHHDFANS